jgi:hypothetical protein
MNVSYLLLFRHLRSGDVMLKAPSSTPTLTTAHYKFFKLNNIYLRGKYVGSSSYKSSTLLLATSQEKQTSLQMLSPGFQPQALLCLQSKLRLNPRLRTPPC